MKITDQDKIRILFSAGFGKIIAENFHANISTKEAHALIDKAIDDYKKTGLDELNISWIGKGAPQESQKWAVNYFSRYSN